MAQYRAIKKAYFGGRVREPGDVVEMDCTPEEAGSAWIPIDAQVPPSASAPDSVDKLFGPAVPPKPGKRAAKDASSQAKPA